MAGARAELFGDNEQSDDQERGGDQGVMFTKFEVGRSDCGLMGEPIACADLGRRPGFRGRVGMEIQVLQLQAVGPVPREIPVFRRLDRDPAG